MKVIVLGAGIIGVTTAYYLAKGGAEGLYCAAHEDGRGFALKAEDGSYRAIGPALGVVLGLDAFREVPLTNSLGETVGSVFA